MIELNALEIAEATAGRLVCGSPAATPASVSIDSRSIVAGDLFFGLQGTSSDGGEFAPAALRAGAAGVMVEPSHLDRSVEAAKADQFVIEVHDVVGALGTTARAWRRRLGSQGTRLIAITGSTGKTSTKDILAALLGRHLAVTATSANLNTEIGMPLTMLAAPRGTDVIVVEMGMRGAGQIAELTAIAEPDVGCIVNVGPVHLEQLGSVENVAAAKAELIRDMPSGSAAVVPIDEPLLVPHRRTDMHTVTFGPEGDVRLLKQDDGELSIATPSGTVAMRPSFGEAHQVSNLLAAIACAQLVGVDPSGDLQVPFSSLRGETLEVVDGITLINDCYNANPVSMRAALDGLATAAGRKIAVLGGMAELGSKRGEFHREIAERAHAAGVDLLIGVGELAIAYELGFEGRHVHIDEPAAAGDFLAGELAPGDTVLVKGSRSVGLEAVADRLVELHAASTGDSK